MFCYRFNSRQQFRTLAAAEGLIVTDQAGNENLITASHTHAIDEIGLIYEGGSYDPQTGEVLTPPTALPGWHVNASGLAPEAWDEFLVVVNTAARQWFGGPSAAPADEVLEQMQ